MTNTAFYKKALIALLAVFVVFLSIYLVLNSKKSAVEQVEYAKANPQQLIKFDSKQIAEVTVGTKSEGSFTFKYGSDGKWTFENEEFRFFPSTITSVVTTMSNLSSTRTIDDNPEDASIYGFAQPYSITCTLKDGVSYSISVGNETPSGSNYYLRKEGDPAVYAVSTDDGTALALVKDALKDPYVLNCSYVDVNYMELIRGDETIYRMEKGDDWKCSYPIEWTTNLANISEVTNSIIRITCNRFVEENCTDLSKYGLDEPYANFRVKSDEGEDVELLFGDKGLDGTWIYAMYADSKQVVTFRMTDVSFIDSTATDFLTTVICPMTLSDVQEMKVQLEGQDIDCQIKLYDDVKEYIVNGKDLKNDTKGRSLFEAFFGGAAGIYFDSVNFDEKPDLTAEPAIRIEYTGNSDSGKTVVEYYKRDELNYYAVVNGEYLGVLVREKVIDDRSGIRRTYAELRDYLAKQ